MENPTTNSSVNWKPIILFYVIACLISWPFFWWRDVNSESWAAWDIPNIVKTWTYMLGPGISVLIVSYLIYRNKLKLDHVTFFGGSVLQSLLFWFVPFILLAIPGIENNWGMNPHLFPLIAMGCLGFISIVGEDSGWAYFLKNMMIKMPPFKRAIVIATLWELWHFTNRTAHKTIIQAFIGVTLMILILIVLTYVMGKITDKTKSLVTAVTIHMWVNVLTENGSIAVYTVFALSLVFWVFMYLNWDKSFWKMRREMVSMNKK